MLVVVVVSSFVENLDEVLVILDFVSVLALLRLLLTSSAHVRVFLVVLDDLSLDEVLVVFEGLVRSGRSFSFLLLLLLVGGFGRRDGGEG